MSENWDKYQEWVIRDLKRLSENIKEINNKLDDISKDTAMLKVKAGMWGMIGGALPVIIALAFYLLKNLI
ncbi:MAG: hypothetical protein H8D45_30995 [Bacteroidetes bacterium]|nr:hypothetical protein [Bacteroidota bacterium]